MIAENPGLACLACALVLFTAAVPAAANPPQLVETDLCIYGGTSGGVVAAVTATRLGRSVVLIEPTRHLGGLSSGGLGKTDTGNSAAIAGFSDEFYRRIGAKYGESTRKFTFEPHIAEEVFNEWIEEENIPVFLESTLVRVEMDGARITELETNRGDVFRAAMFIDTTYEGDLMQMAGVSYTVGREPNIQYGETLNGVRATTPSHQFAVDVDPYVVPGNPGSGLLPHIQPGDGGVPGAGDNGVQAYNFRMCLTQNTGNQIPITAPPGYNVADYELLGRYLQARVAAGHSLTLDSFLKIDAMPNGKTDINNQGAFSTDFIGRNYDYPDSNESRQEIWNATVNYIKGLLFFLGNDPRVPATVRSQMLSWGYCADEFQDTGGFGQQMYVREARRMVSDYVMTQHNAQGSTVAPAPIGLGSYTMDSHNVQRIVQNGVVRNEGDVQVGVPAPYGIAYQSIVPARGECDNLFVTFCLSATHIAFGSARMEPVFMITSQSAATAAAFAIDDGVIVQDVDYAKLAGQLRADGQVLTWGTLPGGDPATIIDNLDPQATVTGSWTSSSSTPGSYLNSYFHDGADDKGAKSVEFTPDLDAAGDYTVYLRWTSFDNRSTNVPVTIFHEGGSDTVIVNQKINGAQWIALGTYPFAQGTGGSLLIETTGTAAGSYVVADAAGWSPDGLDKPVINVISGDPKATEGDPHDPLRITFASDYQVAAPLTITYTVGGTAVGDDLPAPLAGTITIPAGESTADLLVFATDDGLAEGDESLTITLNPSADYQRGTWQAAETTIQDEPFDGWRHREFSAQQLGQPGISGELDDPDNDHSTNLAEFVGGGAPLVPDAGPHVGIDLSGGVVTVDLVRTRQSAGIVIVPETSDSLDSFTPVEDPAPPEILRQGALDRLRFPLEAFPPTGTPRRFYRFRFQRAPDPPLPGTVQLAFWSFDTTTDGNGGFDADPTLLSGFATAAPPLLTRLASAAVTSGGAASYSDPQGTTWLGSGRASTPGHCLGWNPGSTGNSLTLTVPTLGLKMLRLRMDIRSAELAGGDAPTAFDSFTYDTGGGPLPVPGAALGLVQDNQFHEWTADLSGLTAIENQPQVTLVWTIKNLASSPAESLRIDNFLIEATVSTP